MGLSLLTILLLCSLYGCKQSSNLTKVVVNEVAHSIFYAPQYVALELGYFEEEGLNVELINGLGADKTMTAVISGEADIGFMGSEASIYVYNQGAQDYVVNFAQLTQRAGNFLVGRQADDQFSWKKLVGKTVIGGRTGGMPEMVFEYILKKNGIDPKNDLTIVQNIDFGFTAEAFSTGTGDYTVEFEPYANSLENDKKGSVVASLGVDSGKVPYTAYSAKKSYIEKHPEIIEMFTKALQKGIEYVNSHTPEDIADVIQPQFKETDADSLVQIITRYYEQETWKDNLIFTKESFNLLQNILNEAGELEQWVDYDVLVNTSFAQKACGQ